MRGTLDIFIQAITILALCLVTVWVHAGPSTETVLSSNSKKSFSTYVGLTAATNLKNEGPEKSFASEIVVLPSYRLKNHHTISVLISAYKDFKGERRHDLTALQLKWAMPATSIKNLYTLRPQFKLQLPANEDQSRRQGLKSSVSAELAVVISETALNIKDLSMTYLPRITQSFHSREVATTGASNNEYVLSHLVAIDYGLPKNINLGVSLTYLSAQTYQGNIREQFYISEEVSWQINPTIGVALGHSNQGSVRAANGVDSNINIYDAQNSEIYSSVSYRF